VSQNATKIVALFRVSTQRQGHDGLGIAAQKSAVATYAAATGATVVAEFTEVESGRKRSQERPQLQAAIAMSKAKRAVLCVAKLDRVGRRAADVLKLLDDSRVRVVFADSPNASPLQLGILAVVAEEEARAISARTKAALAAAKARGVKLGGRNGAAPLLAYAALNGNRAATEGATRAADEFAADVGPYISAMIDKRMSDVAIAAALNAEGIETRRGGRWHEMSVRRVRARLAA
jgi:DNA invertase Pin-like site-specific DNA recombinase